MRSDKKALVALLFCMLAVGFACSNKQVVFTYQTTGTMLEASKEAGEMLMREGRLKGDDATAFVSAWNDARDSYIEAGILFERWVENNDSVIENDYAETFSHAVEMLGIVRQILARRGVDI